MRGIERNFLRTFCRECYGSVFRGSKWRFRYSLQFRPATTTTGTVGNSKWPELELPEHFLANLKDHLCQEFIGERTLKRGHFRYLNDKPFEHGYIETDGSLIIPRVSENDFGNFTCVGMNIAGNATASVMLYVCSLLFIFTLTGQIK